MPRFLIDVVAQFSSTGLNNVASQARAALEQIARNPGLTPAQRVGQVNATRIEAERSIAEQRRTGTAAAGPDRAAARAVATDAREARLAVRALFTDMEKGAAGFGAEMKAALRGGGAVISEQAAYRRGLGAALPAAGGAGGGGRRPPVAGAAAAPRDPDSPEERAARADKVAAARRRARDDRVAAAKQLEGDEAYIAAGAEAVASRRRRTAEERSMAAATLASDEAYIAEGAAARAAKRLEATRIRAAALGIPDAARRSQGDLRSEIAVQERVLADQSAAAAARQRAAAELSGNNAIAAASAQRRAAERELTAAVHANARREVRAAIARGEGTGFQRLQARFQAGGQSRLPTEFQTAGNFLGSRALTTIGYGVAGTALYGSVRAIGEMLREAEELQVNLNQIEAQLTAVDQAGRFPEARQGILRIARDTGAAADEVARVQFQFQGAFTDASGELDVSRALRETEAAMKVVAVTGLSLEEVLDSLTATARTFNVGIEEIGDIALQVQERFGVLATQTITFVADLAPVANEIGLSLQDLASLGGVAQQVSGRSGTALAEGFGRILPAIAGIRDEVIQLYNLPELQGKRNLILESFATGQTGVVFEQLVRDYDSLSEANKNFVISLLGGRREAQVLIPILQDSSRVTREWDRNLAGLNDSSGKTDDYFANLQQTVQRTKDRFREAANQIGEGLFRAGFADSIAAMVNALGQLMRIIGAGANVFARFNDALGGIPTRLLLMAAAFRFIGRPVAAAMQAIRAKSAANVEEAVTARADVLANEQQAIAQERVGGAAALAAAQVRLAAVADTEEAATSLANARANSTQFAARRLGAGALGAQNTAAGLESLYAPAGPTGLAAGGRFLGRNVGGRLGGVLGAGRSFSGFVGLTLAMEGLNQYFSAQAKAVENAQEEAGKVAEEIANSEDVESTISTLERRAARMRRESDQYIRGGGVFGDIANTIGGRLRGNENALRAGAGADQDFEVIERQIAQYRQQSYADIITTVMANEDAGTKRLIQALAGLGGNEQVDISPLSKIITQNSAEFTGRLREIFVTPDEVFASSEGDLNALVDREELTQENIEAVIAAAAEGDQGAAEFLRLVSEFVTANPALKALYDEQTNTALEDAAREAAGSEGAYQLQTLDQARARYEAGATTVGTFLTQLREKRQNVADAIAAAGRTGTEVNVDDLIALAKIDQEISEVITAAAQNRLDALKTYEDIVGSRGGTDRAGLLAVIDAQIRQVQSLIADPGVSRTDKYAQVPVLIELLQRRFQTELEQITDPVERARRAAQGFQIPESLQALFVEQQIAADPAMMAALETFADITGESLDDTLSEIALALVTTDRSLRDLAQEEIETAITFYEGLLRGMSINQIEHSDIPGILSGLHDLQTGLAPDPVELGGTGYGDTGNDATDNDGADAQRAREEAQLAVQRARANGDPVRLAQLDAQAADIARRYANGDEAALLSAEADRINAVNAAQDAQEEITRARLELYAQQVQRDPVRSAQAQLALARQALSSANGAAEAIQAQQQINEATEDLADAQDDIARAWIEGVVSYFTLIGDTVAAAKAQLDLALLNLNEVMSDVNSGDAERYHAQQAVREAEAGVRNAKFEDQLGDIDYLLDLERITTQQAISMLQSMMTIPGITEDQRRDLERRIKQLQDEVSQDFQFNLPSQIALPTAYEVRRTLGAESLGGGYNDNRQINVTVQANTNASPSEIAKTVADVVGAPSRNGTYPKRYQG